MRDIFDDIFKNEPLDPVEAARRSVRVNLRKRFYTTAGVSDNAVLIGDSIYDMQMAKAAGVRAIGVAWGYHPPADLTTAGADAIVQDYVGLDTALDSLWPVVNHA
jgi:phosphoglycolate phosphatase-like HAD superfamily hydrolase